MMRQSTLSIFFLITVVYLSGCATTETTVSNEYSHSKTIVDQKQGKPVELIIEETISEDSISARINKKIRSPECKVDVYNQYTQVENSPDPVLGLIGLAGAPIGVLDEGPDYLESVAETATGSQSKEKTGEVEKNKTPTGAFKDEIVPADDAVLVVSYKDKIYTTQQASSEGLVEIPLASIVPAMTTYPNRLSIELTANAGDLQMKKWVTIEKEQTYAFFSSDRTPPVITLYEPSSTQRGLKIAKSGNTIHLRGRVEDESSGILEFRINDQICPIQANGLFATDIRLGMGENRIRMSATDLNNNMASKTFVVDRTDASGISLASTTGSFNDPQQYHALIIGNNDYQYLPKLKTAISDAKSIEKILAQEYGFQTRLLVNAKRSDILNAINQYRNRLKADDHFLIYYAGHGEFDKIAGKAYWLPVNASGGNDTEWVIVDTITSNIKRIASRHILIVADSCYSGTLTRSTLTHLTSGTERGKYLQKIMGKKSRTLLASGGNEPVADGGGMGHSVFAQAFMDGLRDTDQPSFTAEELFYRHVKERVAGNAEQIPEYNTIRNSGHDGGDFIFVRH